MKTRVIQTEPRRAGNPGSFHRRRRGGESRDAFRRSDGPLERQPLEDRRRSAGSPSSSLSVFVGMQVGTKQIDQTDANVGESRTADRIISDAGFAVDKNGESTEEQGEMVLIQSKTLTATDPAFRAAIADAVEDARSVPAGDASCARRWPAAMPT